MVKLSCNLFFNKYLIYVFHEYIITDNINNGNSSEMGNVKTRTNVYKYNNYALS